MFIVIKQLFESGIQFIIHRKQFDWMKVWIERCEQSGHGISWEGVASLVKETQRNGDSNVIERGIDWHMV